MGDFTAHWHWPQWTMAALMFVEFVLHASRHGEERLQTGGPDKGQPQKHNGFSALGGTALWLFVLIAGGFFA